MSTVIPTVSYLSKRIIRVLGCNPGPMTLQGTNTYLIGTGKKRILLDTGNPGVPEYIKALQTVLKDNDISLQKILISHWHADHIGGVGDILQNVDASCSVHKFQSSKNHYEGDEWYKQVLNDLNDGQQIETEGATLRVVHTPGHTDDHIILVLEEEKAVFSGDCILGEGTAVFEDLHSYMQSLDAILNLKPSVIYPGHGPVVQDPQPKIQEYISHRMLREKQLLDVLTEVYPKAMTPMELVKVIYVQTPEHLHKAAAYNVSHHLSKLVKDNKVVSSEENGNTKYKLASSPIGN